MKPRSDPISGRARWRPLVVAVALLGILAALAVSPVGAPALTWLSDTFAPRAAVGGPFSLIDQKGKRRSAADFTGRPMLLFFGFTHCPDVCPTTLASVSRWLEALGPDAAKLTPVFVTVDPERDTPALLATYLEAFDPRIVGLTGSPKEVAEMLRRYRVYARKTETGDFEHTAALYLMGRDGKLVQILRDTGGDGAAVAALRRAIGT
jgi:protein SCO1/2